MYSSISDENNSDNNKKYYNVNYCPQSYVTNMAVDANDKESFDSFILNRDKDPDEIVEKNNRRMGGNILILVTFVLELIILSFVVVLEYFLRLVNQH